jgi:hypothetical protein
VKNIPAGHSPQFFHQLGLAQTRHSASVQLTLLTAKLAHADFSRLRVFGVAPNRRNGWPTRKEQLGFTGASSDSGRQTFITQAARKIIQCGGSLRDVQELAGHASLATTQLYSGDAEAKRRVVALL